MDTPLLTGAVVHNIWSHEEIKKKKFSQNYHQILLFNKCFDNIFQTETTNTNSNDQVTQTDLGFTSNKRLYVFSDSQTDFSFSYLDIQVGFWKQILVSSLFTAKPKNYKEIIKLAAIHQIKVNEYNSKEKNSDMDIFASLLPKGHS